LRICAIPDVYFSRPFTTSRVVSTYFLIDEEGTVAWKSVNGSLIPTEALLDTLAAL
jgi:hypothetical protein